MSSPISPTSTSISQPAINSNRRPSSNSRASSSTTTTINSTTTTTTTTGAHPTRNKSSSALSNYSNTSSNHAHSTTSNKPKRNKSSSSLSSHAHGHHGVQFSHGHGHGHSGSSNNLARSSGSTGNRRSSTGRKAAVDFGFTSMVKEVVNAPPPPPPPSSTSTVVKPKSKSKIIVDEESDSEDESEEEEEEEDRLANQAEEDKTVEHANRPEETRRGSSSTLKGKNVVVPLEEVIPITSIQPPTPIIQEVPLPFPPTLPPSTIQSEEIPNSSQRGRGRMTSRTQALAERPEAISYTSGGSDWESALDSPAGPERNARERVSRERSSRERSSRERSTASGRKDGNRDSVLGAGATGGGGVGGSGIRVDTSRSRLNEVNSRERNYRSVTPPLSNQVGGKKNGNGRATFQVGSVGGEFSPMSRSYEQQQQIQKPNTILTTIPHLLQSTVTDSSTILEAQPTRSSSSTSRHSSNNRNMTPPPPLPRQPSFTSTSTSGTNQTSSRMQPPPSSNPPPQIQPPSQQPQQQQQPQQSVPHPSAEPHSPIASTSNSKPYLPRTNRMTSSASLLSIASNRSVAHSLSQFGSPTVRRAVGIAPALDRTTSARAEMIMGGGSGGGNSLTKQSGFGPEGVAGGGTGISDRNRLDSISSLRSLAVGQDSNRSSSALGGLPGRRAATMNSAEGKDALRRLRLSQSISEGGTGSSGSAMAALGNLQQRDKLPASGGGGDNSGFIQAKRTASGYFASLRGFTSIATGMTPPLPPLSPNTPGSRYSSDANSPTIQSKGKSRLPIPSTPHIVISKFLDPPPSLSPLSPSGPNSGHGSGSRTSDSPPPINNYSGALPKSPLGGQEELIMSRTQQKALLARNAPFWSSSSSQPGNNSNIQQNSLLPLPPTANNTSKVATTTTTTKVGTQSTEREIGMQKWAAGLVREAERIERQYRAVEVWRDPLGESLERVLLGNGLNISVELGVGAVVRDM